MHTGHKPCKCKSCPASFKTSSQLASHVKYKHSENKPHKCPYEGCEYSCVAPSMLKRHFNVHMRKVADDEAPPYGYVDHVEDIIEAEVADEDFETECE